MSSFTQFLRMAKWARRPPSTRRVILVAVVIVVCLILFGIERLVGWPDWLTPNRVPRGRI
ncbi:hypothetical protein [Frigidibacter sp. ROC022]|uniref:hypothetical protein n=1 Tax=Frigidibacter sp. ROC022 TaxID=2971796 RepID=UPI00215B5DE7|nr:hypothetical protein [Frigidibacter sp. ROC022]MCR8723591.1 hypothetical protein [Frigidibacter sp. ROC022]